MHSLCRKARQRKKQLEGYKNFYPGGYREATKKRGNGKFTNPLTLCRNFSPDVNSKGASPPGETVLQSDIFSDQGPGKPGRACPVLFKITLDGVVVTVLNHISHPKKITQEFNTPSSARH